MIGVLCGFVLEIYGIYPLIHSGFPYIPEFAVVSVTSNVVEWQIPERRLGFVNPHDFAHVNFWLHCGGVWQHDCDNVS